MTSALRIQERADSKIDILIVTCEFPSDRSIDYASPWASAHYRPIPATTSQEIKEHALSRVTYQVLKQEAAIELAAGIIFLDGFDYLQMRNLSHIGDVFDMAAIVNTVVNCSGFGFGDPNDSITRGKTRKAFGQALRRLTARQVKSVWSQILAIELLLNKIRMGHGLL